MNTDDLGSNAATPTQSFERHPAAGLTTKPHNPLNDKDASHD